MRTVVIHYVWNDEHVIGKKVSSIIWMDPINWKTNQYFEQIYISFSFITTDEFKFVLYFFRLKSQQKN